MGLTAKYVSRKMGWISFSYMAAITVLGTWDASRGMSNSLFDYLSNFKNGGSASLLVLAIGLLPVIAIILPLLMDQLENDMIVVRIKRKRKLFFEHFFFMIGLAVFLTFMIAVIGILGSFIGNGHLHNLWGDQTGTLYFWLDHKSDFGLYLSHVTTLQIWSYLLLSRFLAILFIGITVIFLKLIVKKNIFIFFLSILLVGTDGVLPEQYSVFLGRARITMDTWIAPVDQLFNLVYFLLAITLLSFICLKIYEKKEFYH